MDRNFRFDHIEDILAKLHRGQWFRWSDVNNKVYANLVLVDKVWDQDYTGVNHEEGMIDNPHSKPSEKSLTDALAKEQSDLMHNNMLATAEKNIQAMVINGT